MSHKIITGKAYVLGDNIDTDQIIPAEHLVYSLSDEEESKLYGKFALSGVPRQKAGLPNGEIPFIEGEKFESTYPIIIGGSNFGCGSSREHAPFALFKAGVKLVIAESYARIFYRNSVDGGFIVPLETSTDLVECMKTGQQVQVDLTAFTITNLDTKEVFPLVHPGDVLPIIEAGGLFAYARVSGMI